MQSFPKVEKENFKANKQRHSEGQLIPQGQ